MQLWNNFTYFLDDPVHGDQFSQIDRRWIWGGALSKLWPVKPLGFALRTGLEARYDDIGKVGLYKTETRAVLSTVRQDSLDEYSGALWTEAARAFGPVRVTLGARVDRIGARVHSDDSRNSGSAGEVLVNPKFAAAWRVLDYDFRRVRLKLEVLNLLDSRDDDIRYFYTSRLPGEPAEGVDDYHSHPVEPGSFA